MRAPSWVTVQAMEQARWMRLARLHPENETCARVIRQGRCYSSDVVELAELVSAHGWVLTRAGRPDR